VKQFLTLGLSILTGAALGAAAVNGLHAQGKTPGAYAILDISEVIDAEAMKQIVAKAGPSIKAGGGRYLARTDQVTALSGTPPKRVVIIAFDSTDQAKSWFNSPLQQEVNALADKAIKQRWYVVDSAL
jgi:uncharacterized protein (DUF1330 family)